MKCRFCGSENPELSLNCNNCFAYIYPEEEEAAKLIVPEDTRKYYPLSLISLILGIAGIIVCICYPMGILDSIAAIITGIKAKNKIDVKKQKGEKLAMYGIILGIVALVASITMAIMDYVWKITSLYGTGNPP